MSWWLILPPLPWARTMVLCSEIGSGHEGASGISLARKLEISSTSDDIVFSQCNMNEIPRDMNERGMDFLNSMNAIRGDNETVIGNVCESSTVLAKPGDSEHPFF